MDSAFPSRGNFRFRDTFSLRRLLGRHVTLLRVTARLGLHSHLPRESSCTLTDSFKFVEAVLRDSETR
ncbi:hypothetical protein Mapa_003247 [Marchantia paleacea]|nr:hypothetical protein Mapa_003247 [Marchantia paleacea]